MIGKFNSCVFIFLFFSCAKDVGKIKNDSNYPQEVASLIRTNCSVTGCHNTQSKDACAGLSLSTWEDLFRGARGGPIVIPFRPDFSTLCYFTNSSSALGPILSPQMPVGLKPLTEDEYKILRDWIQIGAPNLKGEIKFQANENRSKLYITNQLCDLVVVVDAESKLPMRYITVGESAKTEFPVCVRVSPDKKNWYVSFLASGILQKFDAGHDLKTGQIDLGVGTWSSFDITSDSRYAFAVDHSNPGKIAYVDLLQEKVICYYKNQNFIYPKSIAIDNKKTKLYVGAENGNYISVIDFKDALNPVFKELILDGTNSASNQSLNDPGALLLDESSGLCYVACRNSNEIKLIDIKKDSVTTSVFLNAVPSFMDYVNKTGQLFVSCMNDSLSFPGNLGSVKVIEIASKKIIKTINSGYQPNGISCNSNYNYVAVINSNINPKGPSPHHKSGCAGRNGNITFIDLSTLELIPSKKYELAVYPYATALRK